MPESPLVQKETVALSDLEALIAARAKGESETETGFRKRIDREEHEYKAAAKHMSDKYRVDNTAMEADYSRARDQVVQTFQRDTQAKKAEYEQTKKQIDDQLRKDTRKAKKTKDESGWQALAMYEGSKDDGIKRRRGTNKLEPSDRQLPGPPGQRRVYPETLRAARKSSRANRRFAGRSRAATTEPAVAVEEIWRRRRRAAARPKPRLKRLRSRCSRGWRCASKSTGRAGLAQASQVSQDRLVYLAVAAVGSGGRGGVGIRHARRLGHRRSRRRHCRGRVGDRSVCRVE